MPFSRDSIRVLGGRMFYQTDKSDEWKRLESTYPMHEKRRTVEDIREILFFNKSISVSQFDRPPVQQNTMLLRDSFRWTIAFDIRKISNIRVREYLDERGVWDIDIIFDCTEPPTGIESTQKRHPRAPNPPADDPSYVGPGRPETFPLAELAHNYAEDGIRQIKLQFPRSIKASGARSWAWPVVVALLLGESDWSTTSKKEPTEELFQLCLEDYVKKPHPYAEFWNNGNGTWRILRKTNAIARPAPDILSFFDQSTSRPTQVSAFTWGNQQPHQPSSHAPESTHRHPDPSQSQNRHVTTPIELHHFGAQSSNERPSQDDAKLSMGEKPQRNREVESEKRHWEDTVTFLEMRRKTLEEEYEKVERELSHAKRMVNSLH